MSNPTPDFSALTDAELDRWIAERDGWSDMECVSAEMWCPYTRSADAAIALAGRWGIGWVRWITTSSEYYVKVVDENWKDAERFYESPEKPFARALSEALAQAKAREGKP